MVGRAWRATQDSTSLAAYSRGVRIPLPAASATNVRRLALANLTANIVLVITGGVVRLTGSGLGCAQWPTCNDGNIVPHAAAPAHTYIEFLNRTLFFVLALIALTAWLVIRRLEPRRKDMSRLAFLIGLGIPAQAVIGGITVLTGLNPYTVMAHLMATMVIIYWCSVLYNRARNLDRVVPEYASKPMHWLARILLGSTYLTLAAGTVVTGSGPHSGDPEAGRTGFDPAFVSQLHADAVFLLIGISITVLVISYIVRADKLRRAAWVMVGVELAQGVVGYVQYFTNLPEALVAIHLLLAAVLMACVTYVAEEIRYVRLGGPRQAERSAMARADSL